MTMKNLFLITFLLFLQYCPFTKIFAQIPIQNGDTLMISLEKTQPDSFAVLKLFKAVSQTHDTLHQKKLIYLMYEWYYT